MNNIKNSVQLVGHLGKDVQLSNFDNGTKKASFSLATNDYYKNAQGEKIQETHWHNIISWGNLAENMNNLLEKGSEVLIKGKLVSRSYDDKSGNKKYITEVVANEFLSFNKKEMPF